MTTTPAPSEADHVFAAHIFNWSTHDGFISEPELAQEVANYVATALAASRRDAERLDWLERFLQTGGASMSTTHESQKRDREDDTEATKWNNPFSIGCTVEVEHRGCYEWREKSNGAKGIRPAIDAAKAAIDAAAKGADSP